MQSGALEIACIAHVPWSPVMESFCINLACSLKKRRKVEWWPTRHGRAQGGMLKAPTIGGEAIKSVAKRRKTA
jgi:hypothetical protein